MKKSIFKILLIIILCFILTGCSEEEQEKKMITTNAIDYFATKYNISNNNIQITDNKLYGNSTLCLTNCPENEIIITLNKEKYIIKYDKKKKIFSDNKEVNKIVSDYKEYIKNSLKVITTISIENEEKIRVTEKYDGDIKKFLKANTLNAILVVESKTQDEAVLNWRTYSTDAIIALEDLNITYNLRFSVIDNDKETIIYNYKSSNINNKITIENNVDNTKLECDRNTLVNATCRNR